MTFSIHKFGGSVELLAESDGLAVRGPQEPAERQNWPGDALAAAGGWRSAIEIEQLIELGLAELRGGAVVLPYRNFEAIRQDVPVSLIDAWVLHSPFLLKIDRKSDLGRPDFLYKYEFLLGGRPVPIERLGYYVRRTGTAEVFLLDIQMYSLVEAMDSFNALPPEAKTPQASWLAFAKVKGCAKEVGATLDGTLRNNDVIIPSALGLDMREDLDGALTFLPRCSELASEDFHQVFERNAEAEKLYSLDRPGLGRVRIVLTDEQQEVLQRMKRVRRVKGELKERLKRDPIQAFDGVADRVDLPYGERVIGIGDFAFAPTPRPTDTESTMARLWRAEGGGAADTAPETEEQRDSSDSEQGATEPGCENAATSADEPPAESHSQEGGSDPAAPPEENGAPAPNAPPKRYLLIETNEESVRPDLISEAETARQFVAGAAFERPRAFREDRSLRPHQEDGVRWLQTCSQIKERTGVLLGDDMGVGKTIQILTFLAWCIESGKFPDLSRSEPPFRPILIVAPLILLDTRTWESEMENFFTNDGVVFWPVLSLHGEQLAKLRRDDAEGREVEIGKPMLDLNRIQRHRVVITNYETIKSYQHSFAYIKDGKPLWSFIISDEAQEYKIPSTRISHAMKALKAQMHIACTGTPVENRLLDLWNICDALKPGLLSSAKEFVARFEKAQDGDGQQNSLLDLKRTLLFHQPHAFLLRRTKSDVAELPPKTVIPLYCDMSEAEIAAHRTLLKALRDDGRPSRYLSALQKFVQLYQHPAMLSDNPEDLSVSDLVSQSSKLRVLLSQLHEIRKKKRESDRVRAFKNHAGNPRQGSASGIRGPGPHHQWRNEIASSGVIECIRPKDAQRDPE